MKLSRLMLLLLDGLDALQTKSDTLRALQASTKAELDALLPSVLNQAFAGKM